MLKKKGFTLIELLVVIGIMAVLAAGVVALIDPLEKTRQANDANLQNAIGQIATAMQSSAAQDPAGNYPQPAAAGGTASVFVTNGEIASLPALPSGSTLTYAVNANPATIAVVYTQLTSKKYISKCAAGVPYWFFNTANGRACGVCGAGAPTTGTACGAF